MFSYANVPLAEPEGSDVAGWIAANIKPQELFPLAYRAWPAYTSYGPVLNNTPDVPTPVVINTLTWPVGASRFARGHFVVTDKQLDLIQGVTYKNGTQAAAQFVFSDSVNSIETDLWMLPPTPLAQCATGLGMWLLTLVDERYYWSGMPLDLTVNVGVTTWEDLYDDIAAVLGATFVVDPVAADYLTPTIDYSTYQKPLSGVLDAIAFSVQQRVVRSYDGTIKIQNYSTAKAAVIANSGWKPYAGGVYNF